MAPSEEIIFEQYCTEALALAAEGRLDDALWVYESALLDPRLDQYPTDRAALGLHLGEMQLQRLLQISDSQAIRKRIAHTIALLRGCTRALAEQHAAEIQLLLARLHCENFERFGEQRDLLMAHMLVDDLVRIRPQDRSWQADVEALRRRIGAAQVARTPL